MLVAGHIAERCQCVIRLAPAVFTRFTMVSETWLAERGFGLLQCQDVILGLCWKKKKKKRILSLDGNIQLVVPFILCDCIPAALCQGEPVPTWPGCTVISKSC